jgi:hypothetical protein
VTQGSGAAAGEGREKERQAVGDSCRGAAANGDAGEVSRERARARGRGKLTGGSRPSAAPGGKKGERREGSRGWAGPGVGPVHARGKEGKEGRTAGLGVVWPVGLWPIRGVRV